MPVPDTFKEQIEPLTAIIDRHNDDFIVENCASVTAARNNSMLAQPIGTINDAMDTPLLVAAVCVVVSVPLLLSSTRDTLVVLFSWPSNILASADSIMVSVLLAKLFKNHTSVVLLPHLQAKATQGRFRRAAVYCGRICRGVFTLNTTVSALIVLLYFLLQLAIPCLHCYETFSILISCILHAVPAGSFG